MFQSLSIDQIDRRPDARALNEASVSALMDSIGTIGLINPIRVREKSGRWEVSAGSHRLAACERLGLADIDCLVVSDDDLHAELSMIDENLCRNELSPAERATQTARRKAIYEELHPETANGKNQHTRVRQLGEGSDAADRFTAETALATGKSERAIQRDAERGSKVIPEVLEMITGTRLDTGTFLDALKRLPPNDQFIRAQRELAIIASEDRGKKRQQKKIALDADVRERAAKQVAEIIAQNVPAAEWEYIKANLAVTTSKEILIALTNITGESVPSGRRAA